MAIPNRPKRWLYLPTVWVLRAAHWCRRQRTIVLGLENLPKTGGCVLAPKHQSNADPPTLTRLLPRTIFFMGKIELFEPRLGRFYFSRAAVFPVDRKDRRSFMGALHLAAELAKMGEVIGVFPEGTKTPGLALGKLHGGAVKIALDAEVSLVPVGIFYDSNEKASWRRRGQLNVVVVGEAIMPEELRAMARPNELLEQRLIIQMERAQHLLVQKQGREIV